MISNRGLVRQLFRCLVCLSAISLGSCIDGREEIWLNANGSGRADVSYSIPAMAAKFKGGEDGVRRLIARFLKDNPVISTFSLDVSTVGDRLKIRVQGNFDSALELKELSQSAFSGELPSSARFMAGEVKVKIEGLTVDFARTISPGKALPGSAFIPKSQTKDRSLTYIIHLPKAAITSNATRIEDAGRTLIWEYPLAQAILNPVTTRFEVPIPIPSWILAVTLASVSILLFLILRRCRKSKNPSKIHPVA